MIDLELIKDQKTYEDYCAEIYSNYKGPDWELIKNFKLELPADLELMHENFYSDKPKHLNDKKGHGDRDIFKIFRFEDEHPTHQQVMTELNLYKAKSVYRLQPPGSMLAPHNDRHGGFTERFLTEQDRQKYTRDDIGKYIYFFEDQELGQFFSVGRTPITWKAGDCIRFPWFAPHSTANVSFTNRPILTIVGITK